MQCPFLLHTGTYYECEVLKDKYGDTRRLMSAWVCTNVWESHCIYYEDLKIDEAEKPAQPLTDEPAILLASRIRHINRIGGCRTLLPDLL